MNRQEMFDKVWDHFVTQGNPLSYDRHGICVYRGRNGSRCAFGVLLPDELYDPRMDQGGGQVASAVIDGYPEVAEHFGIDVPSSGIYTDDSDMWFLNSLQRAHDRVTPNSGEQQWRERGIEASLREFAFRFGLTVPGA